MIKIDLTISIVSHGHKGYIEKILNDINEIDAISFEVIVINNYPIVPIDFNFNNDKFKLVINKFSKGFGQNHNYAFSISKGNFFN